MAQVGRLAGSIIAITGEDYYLVGDSKGPCDFTQFGFAQPVLRQVLHEPYVLLQKIGEVRLEADRLFMSLEGESLAQLLVDVFMIMRNGSISERLWRLCLSHCQQNAEGLWDADWLKNTPSGIWDIVRDVVLRC